MLDPCKRVLDRRAEPHHAATADNRLASKRVAWGESHGGWLFAQQLASDPGVVETDVSQEEWVVVALRACRRVD